MRVGRLSVTILIIVLVGCARQDATTAPGTPTIDTRDISFDIESLPEVQYRSRFPGTIEGFQNAADTDLLVTEHPCLTIDSGFLDSTAEEPLTFLVNSERLPPVSIEEENFLTTYCYDVDLFVEENYATVELQTVEGEQLFTWNFEPDIPLIQPLDEVMGIISGISEAGIYTGGDICLETRQIIVDVPTEAPVRFFVDDILIEIDSVEPLSDLITYCITPGDLNAGIHTLEVRMRVLAGRVAFESKTYRGEFQVIDDG
jgi:hypothetical protein